MATQEHCTVEHLATVFESCRDEIIDEWRLQAAKLLRELKLDRATLTDHVPDIVTGVIRDLSLRREGAPIGDAVPRGQPKHGVQRVRDGLDVGEVVEEFNLLRAAFFTVADRHSLFLVGEAARIISRRIDGDVRMAVMAFAERQASLLKEREDEHLAFIAHDLRTPLNAVSLLFEELKLARDDDDFSGTDETFELLKRNLERVGSLIKGVLHANTPSTGAETSFQPQLRTFELWPIVQALLVDFHTVSTQHGVRVLNEVPRLLTVHADAALVSQVLQNLLGNAFKYAAQGEVTVTAREEAGRVLCTVRDDGAGIPPEMLGRVFEKHATDPARPSTGLGLAIVKQIVEAHEGTVRVESHPGAGAAFHFTLPAPRGE